MTDHNVLTSSRFLNAEAVQKLRDIGIEISTVASLDALELPEPQYGETILGPLTEEEAVIFCELRDAHMALEAQQRELVARTLTRAGEQLRNSDPHKPLGEFVMGEHPISFDTEDEGREFFRLQQRAQALHASFYWMIGERFNVHDYRLGVRSKGRVVKIARRY